MSKMTETEILQLCRIVASDCGATVWRNNTGALKDHKGRLVHFGLCSGSSDLIGIYKGRFLAIEVKRPGKTPTDAQDHFIEFVNNAGGIAFWVDDPKQIKNKLDSIR